MHLGPKDIVHIKEVFRSLDHNKDGCLNLEELKDGISEMKNSEELMELLIAADTDKNGKINYTGKESHKISILNRIHRSNN